MVSTLIPITRAAALFAVIGAGFFLTCVVTARNSAESVVSPRNVPGLPTTEIGERATRAPLVPERRADTAKKEASTARGIESAVNEDVMALPESKAPPTRCFAASPGRSRTNFHSPAGGVIEEVGFKRSASFIPRAPASATFSRSTPIGSAADPVGGSPAPAAEIAISDEPAAIVAPAGDVAIPVAFQALAEDTNLTPVQRKQLETIRKRFVEDIGGTDQNPTSPAYESRWRRAQWTSDQQFRAMFGQQAFQQHQLATARADRRAAE